MYKRKKTTLISVLLILGFFMLFGLRLFLQKDVTTNERPIFNQPEIFSESVVLKNNYATKRHRAANNLGPTRIDQKYEKIAEISSKSSKFKETENQIRQRIKKYNALIQFENKNGNEGFRHLSLVIGVPPTNFDSIYADLTTIGVTLSKQITKKDKTNEYKALNAKKASLEKIRTSLILLKSKVGKIEEFMHLENRILEIEQQLQELGVSLGDFDEENEFCTIKFSLTETKTTTISFAEKALNAFLWTLSTYLKILLIIALITGISYMIKSIMNKTNKRKDKQQ